LSYRITNESISEYPQSYTHLSELQNDVTSTLEAMGEQPVTLRVDGERILAAETGEVIGEVKE
jgi:RNA:NAD 2'-phosphotransferase (TPT1/KptA family)